MSDSNPFPDRKVILFLSVDIIGSTEYKNKNSSQLQWLRFFTDFYKQFPIYFLKNIELISSEFKIQKPTIWKSLGDELIFEVEIKNHKEAQILVAAFSKSVFSYDIIKEMTLKGSAWIAGFPVINAEAFSDGITSPQAKDYIGPQIDIGFRLSKFASNLKFIISVELLVLLTKTTSTLFNFYLDSPETLKGVLGNKPYPIIWIKNENSKEQVLNKLLRRFESPVDYNSLHEFCVNFITDAGKPFMIPFLSEDDEFKNKPDWYEDEYKIIKDILSASEDHQE